MKHIETAKSSIRRRVSPHAALVKRPHSSLSEFFQRVGTAAYGTDWKQTLISEVSRLDLVAPAVGSLGDLAWNTRETIHLALVTGKIKALVPLTVTRLSIIRPVPEPSELPDDDIIEATGDAEETSPRQSLFRIDSAFWSSEAARTAVDWESSKITVDSDYLYDNSSASQPLVAAYEPVLISGAPIWILNPDEAIRKIYRLEELPDDEWFERYKIYRSDFMTELVAAAWRYLLISQSTISEQFLQSKLVQAMQDYLRAQGVDVDQGPQLAALRELARRLKIQWEQKNFSASVLVSTNPRKPRF